VRNVREGDTKARRKPAHKTVRINGYKRYENKKPEEKG
jgi:hypothetical protein